MKIISILFMGMILSSQAFAADLNCNVKSDLLGIESSKSQTLVDKKAKWSMSVDGKTGENLTVQVKVKNEKISYIMIGLSDGEGGQNKDSAPLKKQAQLDIGNDSFITCEITD